MSNITVALKVKLDGCDIRKVAAILGNGEEISDEMVAYSKDAINEVLIELTKLRLLQKNR